MLQFNCSRTKLHPTIGPYSDSASTKAKLPNRVTYVKINIITMSLVPPQQINAYNHTTSSVFRDIHEKVNNDSFYKTGKQ